MNKNIKGVTTLQKPIIIPFIPNTRAVVGFYITDNKILLGKRIISSTNLGVGLYSGIGGKLEDKESSEEALIREFQEEVRTKPTYFSKIGQVIFIFTHKDKQSKWNSVVDVFRIDKLEGIPQSSSSIEPQFFDINNIPFKNMWHDNYYWLNDVIETNKFYAEFIYSGDKEIKEFYKRYI